MMKNIKVDNHQFISRLIYANNALFLQKWDAPSPSLSQQIILLTEQYWGVPHKCGKRYNLGQNFRAYFPQVI